MQGCEFDLSIFQSLICLSFQSLRKIDHDQITIVDLLKRSTGIESLSSNFKKDRPWANCSRRPYEKDRKEQIDPVDLLKRLTVSELIPLILNKYWQERFDLFNNQTNLSIFWSQKTIDSIEKRWSNLPKNQIGPQTGSEICFNLLFRLNCTGSKMTKTQKTVAE